MKNSRVCMMRILTVLPFFFSQLHPGAATPNDVAHWRYRRDNEDKYYDPSTRMSCPPSMLSGDSASGGDSALVLVVDITKSSEKSWPKQLDLLMKAASYLQGAKIAVISIRCDSEIVLPMGTYTEDEIKKEILKQKVGVLVKKGTDQAFNSAEQQLIVS
ncbi:hypothetical protein GCK32_016679 [Trichostrongylus colubriformis]|uniref:VWA domain-containing protein n=1 Tax=Trichostrongylus colubriformis TaxID=6319 RepID=A0AAN8FD84_TRICO